MAFWNFWKSKKIEIDSTSGIRIIETARGIDAIEKAIKENCTNTCYIEKLSLFVFVQVNIVN